MTMPQTQPITGRHLPVGFVESQRAAMLEALDFHDSRIETHADGDDHDLHLAMRRRSIRAREEIATALERLDEDLYGVCVVCQGPIAVERLTAVPHALTCTVCIPS